MEGVLTRWRRWRHARGFGIHSPFAYRLITYTLRQPYAYYAYSRLPERRQRLLYRVALAFGCRTPLAVGIDKAMEEALRLARGHHHAKGPHDFIAIDAARADRDRMADATARIVAGTPAIIYNSRKFPLDEVRAELAHGMTFTNGTTTIVAPLPHLPRQDFEVAF